MSRKQKHTGFAIAIAWPETYCKQPGSWYDPITLTLGINKNNFYRVGHAALVLIDNKRLKARYFDFGRYHSPYKYGRVRSAETDHDLEINTVPVISDDNKYIENFRKILTELQQNPACHGEGELHASYCPVNFEAAFATAKKMVEKSPIPYGPFRFKGSNCSRFVNTAIRAGKPDFRHWFGLYFKVPLTPTPISNVNALENGLVLPKLLKGEPFCPLQKLDKKLLTATLPPPLRHPSIPENAQWLSGEGAGSWFSILPTDGGKFEITRFSPEGEVECNGIFAISGNQAFNPDYSYRIDYLSHCRQVTVWQKNQKLALVRKNTKKIRNRPSFTQKQEKVEAVFF
ncbi:DUF6695 family protein [Draconibacterium sediminis]|uniref:DUF6695 family protein n=1 Tax=Draconibacterium sediminis TaxID=1544798 RepID=UPI0026F29B22|nr:DUF6695 family protein [Draconibacterium sediminis]